MRYTVRESYVQVVGSIWMPKVTCGQEKILSQYDIDNIRDRVEPGITRANVEDWLTCNSGDFSSVDDFSASIEDGGNTINIPWASEEGEFAYVDCVYTDD